jgi:hypothetical protein
MSRREYEYVGPARIRQAVSAAETGYAPTSNANLERWLAGHPDVLSEGATYVVDTGGALRLALRRSEHVACAGGGRVLAAGEIRFLIRDGQASVAEVTNQSTGYCPEPDCWPAVAEALKKIGVIAPDDFTHAFIFRHCPRCGLLNLVKESWFFCVGCDSPLPRERPAV